MAARIKHSIQDIVNAGRVAYGIHGEEFRMSDVAKQLNTRASTLYRHVENKRELYYAMLIEEYRLLSKRIDELIYEIHEPTPLNVLTSIGQYILDLSREDFERFSLMFLTKPPESEGGPGPYEQACEPKAIGFIQNLVEDHFRSMGTPVENLSFITYTIISTVIGAGLVTSNYYEYLNFDQSIRSEQHHNEFHKYIVENTLTEYLTCEAKYTKK